MAILRSVTIFMIATLQTECVVNKVSVIDETPVAITVVAGTTAVLPCSVDPRVTAEQPNNSYKVLWVNPQETVVSMEDRRMINDIRVSVERQQVKDWNLNIRNVSLSDQGVYRCQINTAPVGTKRIQLVVTEPPRIFEHSPSTEVEKAEGESVQLSCNATGTPPPEITWYRLHKKTSGVRERVGQTGESLVIHNVSRVCGDWYECEANNGVLPSSRLTFKVTVFYLPEVRLPNSRLGQHVGKDTILDCEVSASPLGNAVWIHNGVSLSNSNNHEVQLYANNNPEDSVTLSLRILRVEPEDFGLYICEATNSLGVNSQTMELFELPTKTSAPTVVTSTLTADPRFSVWPGLNQEMIVLDNSDKKTSHTGPSDSGQRQDQNSNQGSIAELQSSEPGNKQPGNAHSTGDDNEADSAGLLRSRATSVILTLLLVNTLSVWLS